MLSPPVMRNGSRLQRHAAVYQQPHLEPIVLHIVCTDLAASTNVRIYLLLDKILVCKWYGGRGVGNHSVHGHVVRVVV